LLLCPSIKTLRVYFTPVSSIGPNIMLELNMFRFIVVKICCPKFRFSF
jgi:hypothetical protein